MRLFSFFLLAACIIGCTSKQKNNSTGITYSFSNFFNECTPSKEYALKEVIDTVNNFKIYLPHDWDTELLNNNDIHGLFAMDTSLFIQKELIHSILINSINLKESLDVYFKSELKNMHRDSIPIIEVGSIMLGTNDARWIINSRTNPEGSSKELLVYTKGQQNKILVINIRIGDTEDYKEVLCSFKEALISISFFQSEKILA